MAGFQTRVNTYPAPAIEGDWASANPETTAINPIEATLISGPSGLTVGRFAWVDASGVATNAGTGTPAGFVRRGFNALITAFLGETSNVIVAGQPVNLFNNGDFWARTATNATIGQKVFASLTDGSIKTAAAGATVSGYIETKWAVASAASANELIKITAWGV